MSKEYKQEDVELTDADRKVILEGKIPMKRERYEALMSAIYVQLDNVHGETETIWEEVPHETDEHGKPKTYSGQPPKKHSSKHIHKADAELAVGTPHETWHYMNDVYIAVVDFENVSDEKPVPAVTSKPIVTLKKLKLKTVAKK